MQREKGPVSGAVGRMGAKHISTEHEEIVFDAKKKLVTTPCYMLDITISQMARGAERLVQKVLIMI